MKLTSEIYPSRLAFPEHQLYPGGSEAGRAAVSVPGTMAPGKGRDSDQKFWPWLFQARPSLLAFATLPVAEPLQYLSQECGLRRSAMADCVGLALSGFDHCLLDHCLSRDGCVIPNRPRG